MKGRGYGVLMDIVLGVVGGMIGAWCLACWDWRRGMWLAPSSCRLWER
jgi:uncharacterized membrane protein YeaQ/YmgE (transglycosylase-associated protein family)